MRLIMIGIGTILLGVTLQQLPVNVFVGYISLSQQIGIGYIFNSIGYAGISLGSVFIGTGILQRYIARRLKLKDSAASEETPELTDQDI